MRCSEVTAQTTTPRGREVQCQREVDESGRHKGSHFAIYRAEAHIRGTTEIPARDHAATWFDGGAQGEVWSPHNAVNCTCRTHEPEDHHEAQCIECDIPFASTGSKLCFSCDLWLSRAEQFGQVVGQPRGRWMRSIRVHGDELSGKPSLYTWSHGLSGAFGGRQFTVDWDDGQIVGPADFLWYSGVIPWWLEDHFPTNGTVTAGSTVPRPGYTDSSGRPLEFTGHPPIWEEWS